MKHMALGLLIGLLILPLALGIALFWIKVPVTVADKPFTWEEQIVQMYRNHRIAKEMPKNAPVEADAYNLLTGMQVYRSQCASCHGLYGQSSTFAAHMYPKAPELWKLRAGGAVGVSDVPVGRTFWHVANGHRLTGMPSYKGVLTDTQMWQVSLLLANANKPLPYDVLELLKKPMPTEPIPVSAPPNPDFPEMPALPKLPVAPIPSSK